VQSRHRSAPSRDRFSRIETWPIMLWRLAWTPPRSSARCTRIHRGRRRRRVYRRPRRKFARDSRRVLLVCHPTRLTFSGASNKHYPEHGNRFTGEPAYFDHTLHGAQGIVGRAESKTKRFRLCNFFINQMLNFRKPPRKSWGFTKEQIGHRATQAAKSATRTPGQR